MVSPQLIGHTAERSPHCSLLVGRVLRQDTAVPIASTTPASTRSSASTAPCSMMAGLCAATIDATSVQPCVEDGEQLRCVRWCERSDLE